MFAQDPKEVNEAGHDVLNGAVTSFPACRIKESWSLTTYPSAPLFLHLRSLQCPLASSNWIVKGKRRVDQLS